MTNQTVAWAVYEAVIVAVGETVAKRRGVHWTVNHAWYTAWYTAGFAAMPMAVAGAEAPRGGPPHPGLELYLGSVT